MLHIYVKLLYFSKVSLCLHHQISRILPAKQSIKHIRRLSKAITGALYPVLSDHSGQSFFDISAAVPEMIIVKPLIIHVMMERNYQLVAWTENITDKEDARLYMIPSLECEVQADLVTDLTFIHREEYKFDGPASLDFSRRAVLAYERMSRFEILTGHPGDGIRYLFFAAWYCIWEDDRDWVYYDTDLGSYSYFCGELRYEFIRLCEEGMRLAKKFRREDVLQEGKPKRMLEMYYEQTQEERDLERHLKEMSAWQ